MPVFWNANNSEPKRQHRFLVRLGITDRFGTELPTYLARSVKTPAFSISETEHKFLGNTYYYPGTVSWEECTMTIVNSIDPDGNRLLYDALLRSGYLLPSEQAQDGAGPESGLGAGAGTINKGASVGALGGEVKIRELNGAGLVVGTWVLENAWLKSASFGDLDYSGDEMLNIDISIRYDYATYKPASGMAASAPQPASPEQSGRRLADLPAPPTGA